MVKTFLFATGRIGALTVATAASRTLDKARLVLTVLHQELLGDPTMLFASVRTVAPGSGHAGSA
jgi:hypothetical protein